MDVIIKFFEGQHPIIQGLIATIFTWAVTAAGAAVVFLFRDLNRRLLDTLLGFTGGVMLAASFWSLLNPALEMAGVTWKAGWQWVPVGIGFILGALFIFALDQYLPHLHLNAPMEKREGVKTDWNRTILLILAITLHNIPEGLAVGVAFGAVAEGLPGADLGGAIALAIGIGIQDFPEGLAVAVPLRRYGLSRAKAFWWGQLSGVVEPIAGVLGVALVLLAQPLLPYALAFAAGAMIYVVVEEVIPEAQSEKNTDRATLGLIFGFVLMMALDVGLG
ncbi:MAG: ZIP family metal transporter [Bacteroidetes bacterium]|nr:ZIP family metal transporter [Bacteroidota bacterium]